MLLQLVMLIVCFEWNPDLSSASTLVLMLPHVMTLWCWDDQGLSLLINLCPFSSEIAANRKNKFCVNYKTISKWPGFTRMQFAWCLKVGLGACL